MSVWRAKGFRTFLPRISRKIQRLRTVTTRLVPMFAGCVFVQLDPTTAETMIADYPGDLSPVPGNAIAALAMRCDGEILRTTDSADLRGHRPDRTETPVGQAIGRICDLGAEGRVAALFDLVAAAGTGALPATALSA